MTTQEILAAARAAKSALGIAPTQQRDRALPAGPPSSRQTPPTWTPPAAISQR